jgi:hypothetical protein
MDVARTVQHGMDDGHSAHGARRERSAPCPAMSDAQGLLWRLAAVREH